MATFPPKRVALATFVRGFDEAYSRLTAAISTHESSPDDVFVPMFEALNWTVPLWMLAKKTGVTLKIDESDLRGLREARNRAHHQWAEALELEDITLPPAPIIAGGGSGRGRVTYIRPTSAWAWVWVEEARLPPPVKGHEHPKDRAAYIDRLESRPAYEVLSRISDGLSSLR
jgi:hypothetical protein